MLKYLILILKRIIRDFKSRLIIFLIALLLLLGTIVSINKKTTEEMLNKETYSKYHNRLYQLVKKESYETKKKDIKGIPHIITILHEYNIASEYLSSETFKTPNTDHTIQAYTADNLSLPEIKYGTNFPDKQGFYMVCPINMYPNSNLSANNIGFKITNKDKIDMQKYLNQSIQFQFENINTTTTKKETITIKITGLYEVDKNSLYDNTCYINETTKKYIYDTLNNDLPSYIEKSNPEAAIIIIDDIKNINEIEKNLNKLGYRLDPYTIIDPDFLIETKKINKTYSQLLSYICIILLFIIFFKNTQNRLEYNKLLKYLGAKKYNIYLTNIIHNMLILLLAFILSIIFSIIYRYLLEIIISFRPFLFSKNEIVFSITYLLKIFIVILPSTLIISILNNIYIKYKLNKN